MQLPQPWVEAQLKADEGRQTSRLNRVLQFLKSLEIMRDGLLDKKMRASPSGGDGDGQMARGRVCNDDARGPPPKRFRQIVVHGNAAQFVVRQRRGSRAVDAKPLPAQSAQVPEVLAADRS